MSEHFQAIVDHVMGDDDSELGKTKAELSYALFSLEREISICAQTQARNDVLVKALEAISRATIEGRVCDDVAWFDEITTLHDFCEITLDRVDAPAQRPFPDLVAQMPMLPDVAQIISNGWKSGKSSIDVAAEILREFDAAPLTPAERPDVENKGG